ncbi:gamma-glutamylcyclotransferase [Aureimonas psammosilenae]|uniref:gamma-glutamylcyclotransferase n=1 Tax=Aureimonas psammosilenae TaxID=2495496 RepID=UPI0012612CB1|nr:gamma-glutamylcyclotransferase [Aureimonas psammosilenae]
MTDLWVFGYASLIWQPGFAFEERVKARLSGYHRALCIHSHVHRGTPERPGLVFGLDRGGSCIGMAFRVAPDKAAEVLDYLRARELVTNVYRETAASVLLADGRRVHATTFVADRGHSQYAGRLDPKAAAMIVAGAHGSSGANVDYVRSSFAEIAALGLSDRWLAEVVARL